MVQPSFRVRELHAKRVQFSHVRVFSDSRNVQKRATKSDTSGHCLAGSKAGVGHMPAKECIRGLKEAGHSRTELVCRRMCIVL